METQIQAVARLAVSLYAFFLFSESFRRRQEIERFYQISIINAGMGFWNFFLFLYYSLPSPGAVYLVSQWGFVSVCLTIFGFFFFSCRLVYGRKYDRMMPAFAAIPVVSCLLSMTASFQALFLAGHDGFVYMPLRELSLRTGPWFAVYSVSSYVLSIAAILLLLAQCVKPHVKNRPVILLLAISVLLFSVVLFLSNFTPSKGIVQPYAFIAHLLCVSFFYWATFLDEDDATIYFGKRLFYDALGLPILIFNVRNELLQVNEDARLYFSEIHFPVDKYSSYESLLDGTHFFRVEIGGESSGDASFFGQCVRSGQIIYFHQRDIVNKRQKRLGFSVTLYNLRRMDALMRGLESRAYSDVLCQCFNRTCFEQRKLDMLRDAPRPLALLVADVDDLKAVNDRYGHKAGDEYLATCVRVLKKVTRSGDAIFRIGGDEFVLFLPGMEEAGIQRIRKAISHEFDALKMDYPGNISIGFSIIGEGDTDLDKHFTMADADMYRRKRGNKALGRR